jgi:hypothetical protein
MPSNVAVSPKEWDGTQDVILVPVNDIVIPDGMGKPDPVLVASLANSIETFGPIHPIAVRERLMAFGKVRTVILVAGCNRLAAYKMLGKEQIPCSCFPNDEIGAKFVRFSENLCRTNKTVLQEADDIAQLVQFLENHKLGLFGQNVRNWGRPLSRAAKAAKISDVRAEKKCRHLRGRHGRLADSEPRGFEGANRRRGMRRSLWRSFTLFQRCSPVTQSS